MSRASRCRTVLFAAAASIGLMGHHASANDAPSRPPNIVLIVADDLGYAETGAQGCKDIPTPNIDSIARGGVRFAQGYVTCPVCAPTRAGLLTGRYQQRFGFEHNPGPEQFADAKFGLPLDQPTLAERLKPLGYATGMVGKWHIGYRADVTPPKRGFDEFFGFLGGARNYLPGGSRADLFRGDQPVEDERDYLTDAFGREAVAFIEKRKSEPFFLYLPFNAVHAPMEATDDYRRRVAAIEDPERRTFAAMMVAMDDAVGRVLDTLRKEKLDDNTLVIFISDNGGPTSQTTSGNAPLRGFKAQVWEGGIRVPFMMRWPGQLPAGRVFDQPVISLDIVPTVLAATGKPAMPDQKLDGVNLLAHLRGEVQTRPHDTLYWRFGAQAAMRAGDFKLVRQRQDEPWQLYNLAEDVGESRDLAGQMPEKVRELETLWKQWDAQLMAPRWFRQDGRNPRRRPGAMPAGQDIADRFRQMDRNNDGKLTRDEVGRDRLFQRLDRDKNGQVTLDEARAALGATTRPADGE